MTFSIRNSISFNNKINYSKRSFAITFSFNVKFEVKSFVKKLKTKIKKIKYTEVHEDGERVPLLRPQFLQEGVRAMEGAVDGGHEHPSLKVDEPKLLPVAPQDGYPGPRALGRIVGGAQHPRLLVQNGVEGVLVPTLFVRMLDWRFLQA